MSLYRTNAAWRRNPKKLARAIEHLRAQRERDDAAAEVDSATRRYEELKEEGSDGSLERTDKG